MFLTKKLTTTSTETKARVNGPSEKGPLKRGPDFIVAPKKLPYKEKVLHRAISTYSECLDTATQLPHPHHMIKSLGMRRTKVFNNDKTASLLCKSACLR